MSIDSAPDAQLGVHLANRRSPDLILLDYDLPGLDGLGALQLLRAHRDQGQTPIIAITGALRLSSRCRNMIAGCDGYLPKPFEFSEVRRTVLSLLPTDPPCPAQ